MTATKASDATSAALEVEEGEIEEGEIADEGAVDTPSSLAPGDTSGWNPSQKRPRSVNDLQRNQENANPKKKKKKKKKQQPQQIGQQTTLNPNAQPFDGQIGSSF